MHLKVSALVSLKLEVLTFTTTYALTFFKVWVIKHVLSRHLVINNNYSSMVNVYSSTYRNAYTYDLR